MNLTRFFSWILMGLALSIFLYVGTNFAYMTSSQAAVLSEWEAQHKPVGVTVPGDGSRSAPQSRGTTVGFRRPRLSRGQPLAKILIPAIKFSGIVLEGTDGEVLAGGPGHLDATAYPGEPDNMVISNHNTYSLAFADLKKGDKIILDAGYGTFTYVITGFRVIEANDKSVTKSTSPSATMNFTTCYPLWAGALGKQRYVVTAAME